jgi:Ca2+-binding RTX toxin-like protein
VLWSHTGGKHDVWKVNSEGNFSSYVKAKLWEDEEKFGVDINGDGGTGLIEIEGSGNLALKHEGNKYFIVEGSNDPIGLTYRGAPKGPNSFAGWCATQVEASESEGYEVLWSHSSGIWQVWNVNALGSFQSRYSAQLWKHENTFDYDLNRDTTKGLVTIEDNGNVDLARGDNGFIGDTQYYIVDGTDAPIGLTYRGAPKGPNSFAGWSATQVEANASGGYEVFWSHSSGKTTAWKVNELGSYQSHISVTKSVTESGITIIKYNDHSWKFGGNGNDSLSGSSGGDTLDGGAGNDQIDGGTGCDTITTGSGLDKIILRIGDGGNTLSDADIITDFTDGSDNFGLDGGLLFSQLVIAQGSDANASDTIISAGSEYLAILQGINIIQLSDADFVTVDIA